MFPDSCQDLNLLFDNVSQFYDTDQARATSPP
jgi:hypothetical protein